MASTGPDDQSDTHSSGVEFLFEHTTDCIVEGSIQDSEPIVHRVNDAFESVFGYTNSELRGKNLNDFITPDGKRGEVEAVDRAIREGDIGPREVTRETADGPRDFLFRATGGDGERSYAIYTDITAQKRRDRKLERYETIVEALGDPVYTVDADGYYTFVNDAFVEETGYSREEILGEHVSTVLPEEDIERGRDIIQGILDSEDRRTATWEMIRITADGRRVPTENHLAMLPPGEDEEFRGTAGVIRDISDRKERERQLQRERDRLDEFASIVSHDLRNPLNVAKGRLDLAREECDSEHLAVVDDAHDRMQALIDDLLTLARDGETITDVEPVTLPGLIEECWQTVARHDATVRIETDRTVLADRSRLRQLLENLLRNAIDHGGEDVTVTVGDLSDVGGFYVEDDGPGIPTGKRERVFEAGYSTTEEGTGFGLNIVEAIADAHDWSVRVTDGVDGGARFEFTDIETRG